MAELTQRHGDIAQSDLEGVKKMRRTVTRLNRVYRSVELHTNILAVFFE